MDNREVTTTIEYINFTSPINEDDGVYHNFIGHARSQVELVYDPHSESARLDWNYTFIDREHKGKTGREQILIYFNRKRLVSFEGVFELPAQIIDFLEQRGFDCRLAKAGRT